MDIFVATAKDDLTATANRMAGAIDHLSGKVKSATEASKKFNQNLLNKGLQESDRLLRAGLITVSEYRKALLNAGIAASRADQIIARMPAALRATRKAQHELTQEQKASDRALQHFIRTQERAGQAAERAADRAVRAHQREQRALEKKNARAHAEQAKMRAADRSGMWSRATGLAGYGVGAMGAAAGFAAYEGVNFVKHEVARGQHLLETVVQAAQERQNTMVALRDSLKGTEEMREKDATTLYNAIVQMAIKTPLDTPFLLERMQELIVQGWKPQETLHLMKMIADQESEFHAGAGQYMANFFARIRGAGVVTLRDLYTLQAAKVQLEPLYEHLASKLGVTGETKGMAKSRHRKAGELGIGVKASDALTNDKQARMIAVRKAITGRLVTPEMMVEALTASHIERHGGIGTFAEKAQHTLTGAISNWKNMFGDMLKMTDITKWKGLESLTNFLIRAQTIITSKDDMGGTLIKSIEHFVDSVLGGLDNIDATVIRNYLNWLIKELDWASGKAKEIWDWIDKVGHAHSLGEGLSIAIDGVKSQLWEVAALAGEAFSVGLKAGLFGRGFAAADAGYEAMQKEGGVSGALAQVPFLRMAFTNGTYDQAYAKRISDLGGDPADYMAPGFRNTYRADQARQRMSEEGYNPNWNLSIPGRTSEPDAVSAAQNGDPQKYLQWTGDMYIEAKLPEGTDTQSVVEELHKTGRRGVIAVHEKEASRRGG